MYRCRCVSCTCTERKYLAQDMYQERICPVNGRVSGAGSAGMSPPSSPRLAPRAGLQQSGLLREMWSTGVFHAYFLGLMYVIGARHYV